MQREIQFSKTKNTGKYTFGYFRHIQSDALLLKKNNKCIYEQLEIHLTTILTISEELPLEPIQYWFYSAEKFPRFHYVYNQTMDCKSRVEKMGTSGIQTHHMPKKVFIKIGIIGESTDNVCNLISKRKGSVKNY